MVTLPDDVAASVSTALLITSSRALRESRDRELSPTVREQRRIYAAYVDTIVDHIDRALAA